MGFLWVNGFSFFHCVACPFYSFVTTGGSALAVIRGAVLEVDEERSENSSTSNSRRSNKTIGALSDVAREAINKSNSIDIYPTSNILVA